MKIIKKVQRFDISFICKIRNDHFAQPILKELDEKYHIQYLYSGHKFFYRHLLVQSNIIWVEWANRLAMQVSKKKWRNKKVIIRLHRNEISSRYLNKIQWENVDHVVFVNSNIKNEFDQKFENQIKTITIPNAINVESFPYHYKKHNKSICAYGYTFNPIKGYDNLIKMFSKLVKTDPEFHLTIMGMITKQHSSIRHLREIKKLIIDLNISDHISIIEKDLVTSLINDRKNISNFLANHDIIMSYSNVESFHYSFAEGLLSGLEGFYNMWHNPIINEFWENWGYESESALIKAIFKWVNLSQKEKEIKTLENRQYVINHFGSKVIGKHYQKLLFEN